MGMELKMLTSSVLQQRMAIPLLSSTEFIQFRKKIAILTYLNKILQLFQQT